MNYDIINNSVDYKKKFKFINLEKIINIEDFKKDEILFIDTETTGLSGGAGNFIFLYSFGIFENNSFKITQIFLKSFDSEKYILDVVLDFLKSRNIYITFNGKSFDIPLIKTRFIINQIFEILDIVDSKLHVDLYHISRILYKDRFGKYNLQTLEKELLGFYREDDIDSNLIPFEYFRFIRGESSKISKIIKHNYHDVLSLLKLIEIYEEDIVLKKFRLNYNNLIKYLIRYKRYEIAKKILFDNEFYLQNENLFYYLIILLKKKKAYETILRLFNKYYDSFNFSPKLFVEYLKILEHYKKDYKKALLLYDKEKPRINLIGLVDEDILKRINRIKKKYYKVIQKNGN